MITFLKFKTLEKLDRVYLWLMVVGWKPTSARTFPNSKKTIPSSIKTTFLVVATFFANVRTFSLGNDYYISKKVSIVYLFYNFTKVNIFMNQ
mgnify:FL=1